LKFRHSPSIKKGHMNINEHHKRVKKRIFWSIIPNYEDPFVNLTLRKKGLKALNVFAYFFLLHQFIFCNDCFNWIWINLTDIKGLIQYHNYTMIKDKIKKWRVMGWLLKHKNITCSHRIAIKKKNQIKF